MSAGGRPSSAAWGGSSLGIEAILLLGSRLGPWRTGCSSEGARLRSVVTRSLLASHRHKPSLEWPLAIFPYVPCLCPPIVLGISLPRLSGSQELGLNPSPCCFLVVKGSSQPHFVQPVSRGSNVRIICFLFSVSPVFGIQYRRRR